MVTPSASRRPDHLPHSARFRPSVRHDRGRAAGPTTALTGSARVENTGSFAITGSAARPAVPNDATETRPQTPSRAHRSACPRHGCGNRIGWPVAKDRSARCRYDAELLEKAECVPDLPSGRLAFLVPRTSAGCVDGEVDGDHLVEGGALENRVADRWARSTASHVDSKMAGLPLRRSSGCAAVLLNIVSDTAIAVSARAESSEIALALVAAGWPPRRLYACRP